MEVHLKADENGAMAPIGHTVFQLYRQSWGRVWPTRTLRPLKRYLNASVILKDEQGLKHIERVINTAGYHYWLKCDECLKVCPLNKNEES